ncbi:peptide chain release factor H [Iodobacter sp. HSC-16F04]|uniref:Peptide chain release factor H n=1 Tax=Iodobacter violaceini TaxID=3044271 RepID=A0ABX0L1L8_9NEIS|nr:peptide chain release factor H [Iodobacter violacea]NHQ88627.1 peptide chain release factor H [Iodobacter violacea]
MILLQLSAAQGPLECQLAVSKALNRLIFEARQRQLKLDILEQEAGDKTGVYRSVLISLDGTGAEALARLWEGTVQWICPSPYRPRQLRKNWFIGVLRCTETQRDLSGEIRFETMRSSGPGGQHVNKTESAVRATHLATGISVKVQTERSQHANKRLAEMLIAHRLASLAGEASASQRSERRLMHYQIERGSPKRIFKGERFELVIA